MVLAWLLFKSECSRDKVFTVSSMSQMFLHCSWWYSKQQHSMLRSLHAVQFTRQWRAAPLSWRSIWDSEHKVLKTHIKSLQAAVLPSPWRLELEMEVHSALCCSAVKLTCGEGSHLEAMVPSLHFHLRHDLRKRSSMLKPHSGYLRPSQRCWTSLKPGNNARCPFCCLAVGFLSS